MKKTFDIILIILIFFIIYFLQTYFFNIFTIAGIMPNLFVIFIMMIGLFLKKDFAFFSGIIFGILLDFFIGNRIGVYSIALSITGIISIKLERTFSKDNKLTIMLITSILTIVFELLVYLLNIIFGNISQIEFFSFLRLIIIETIFNSIIIIILYPFLYKFGKRLEEDFTDKNFFSKW